MLDPTEAWENARTAIKYEDKRIVIVRPSSKLVTEC